MLRSAKFIGLLALGVMVWAQAGRDPVPIAKKALDLLMAEKYPELRAMFNERLSAALTEQAFRQQVGPQIKALGQPQGFADPKVQNVGEVQTVVFPGKFASGYFNFLISIDSQDKIAGLFLQPGEAAAQANEKGAAEWTPPSYSDPAAFSDRNVVVTTGQYSLPGTLSVPVTPGKHPGLVLVQGSGPQDRDESGFAYKPFRDLAEGLASRGVVVLRYDKRTFVYRSPEIAKGITVNEETVDDALSSLKLLRSQKEVDGTKLFVLGHSLGGYLVPRITQRDGRLAGAVILAGNARPLEDVILEQNKYFGATGGTLEAVERTVSAVKNLTTADAGASFFGVPGTYFLDLKGYDAPAQASGLKCRLLVLQGGRDFQVTMTDFRLWQTALARDREATLRSYPSLNHFFVAGTGRSTPQEYRTPGHVALEVITEISNWIKS
jgi:uncharacterized protein